MAWVKAAKKIIQTLWKMKGCYIFHVPVDPEKLNCYDYFDIVKKPMDMGTIKTRLNQGFYENGQDFLDDMALTFSNCITYNGAESEIGKLSLNIESEYKRLLKENKLKELVEADEYMKKGMDADDQPDKIDGTTRNSQSVSQSGDNE